MSRVLRLPEVLERVPLKRATIYKHIQAKLFPAPIKMGGASGWPEDEIDAYVARLKSARPANPPSGS